MSTVVLRFPQQLGIRSADAIVAAFAPLLHHIEKRQPVKVTIDMRNVTGIYPTGMTMICASVLHLRALGLCTGVTIQTPKDREVHGYITRMGFYRLLGADVPYDLKAKNPSGRFFEVQQVADEEAIIPISRQWMEIIREQCAVNDISTLMGMSAAMSEILDNVFHHAKSPIKAIVAAQAYPNRRLIEIAIVDAGRGFLRSLHDNPLYTSTIENSTQAIYRASDNLVTGTTNPARGMGLYHTRERVVRNQGMMYIRSYEGKLLINDGLAHEEHMFYNVRDLWPGAVVALLLNMDKPLDIKSLLDAEFPEDAESDLFVE